MSATYDKLVKLLEEKGSLENTDIESATKELGEMTPQEMIDLSAAQLKKQSKTSISMEQYLAATKVLDSAAEGSPEYEAALKVVEAYENA